jgi:predicted secreted Zn-dependent protease
MQPILSSPKMLLLLAVWLSPAVARAEWQAVEKVERYAISGTTGAELYASIGENGPTIGGSKFRTIAYTDFKLTWQRSYEPQGDGACTLASARPKLIITYRLPKPPAKLPDAVGKSWERFAAGVQAHERVHGEMIKDMVKAIEAASVGLSAPADPKCSKVRTELQQRLSALSQAQRQKSRDFDRDEMSEGGNIHQLILQLVNGP